MAAPIEEASGITTEEAFGIPTIYLVDSPIDYQVAGALLACLESALALNPNPPASVCLRSGREVQFGVSTTQDECCDGLGWVRVDAFYASEINFPEEDTVARNCAPGQYALRLEIGVARCAEWGDEANLPTCDQQTTLARQISLDRRAIQEAICCLRAQYTELLGDPRVPTIEGTWEQLDIEGGCAGSSKMITLAVLSSCC